MLTSNFLYLLLLLLVPLCATAISNSTNRATTFGASKNYCPGASPMCHCNLNDEDKLTATCSKDVNKFPEHLPANLSVLNIHCESRIDGQGRPIIDFKFMNSIPAMALRATPNIEELVISGCPVSELPPFVFANLNKLHSLSLESLLLRNLGDTILHNSTNLRALQIINMADMTDVDPNLLARQTQLSTLVLKRTRLNGNVVHKMLKSLKTTLRDLTWSYSSVPVTIPITTFIGFRLRTLNLKLNKLTEMSFLINTRVRYLSLMGNLALATTPPFDFSRCKGLRNLIELDLSSTNLRELRDNSLSRMSRMRKLYLRNNLLQEVPGDIYAGDLQRSRLQELDLANNQIQVIPEKLRRLFQKQRFIVVLDGNPLHCNCEAAWLLGFPRRLYGLRCASAPITRADLKGRPLAGLKVSQLVCIAPSGPTIRATNMVQMRNSGWGRMSTYVAVPASKDQSEKGLIQYEDGVKYISVSRGQTLSLRCTSDGDPAPDLFWIFPWESVLRREATKDRTINYNEIGAKIHQARLGSMRIANFTCRATNRMAIKTDFIILKNMHPIIATTKPNPSDPNKPGDKVTPQPSKGGPNSSFISTRPCLPLILLLPVLLFLSVRIS